MAATSLGKIPSEHAVAELGRLTKDDRSPLVQAAALDALGQQSPRQAIPIILDALDSSAVGTPTKAGLSCRTAHGRGIECIENELPRRLLTEGVKGGCLHQGRPVVLGKPT